MRGDVLEILGLPLEFWSHTDTLNTDFSAGDYEKQSVLFARDGWTYGMGESGSVAACGESRPDFLKKLSPAPARFITGSAKTGSRADFWWTRARKKIETAAAETHPLTGLLAAGRAALQYEYSLGITAWLDPLAGEKCVAGLQGASGPGRADVRRWVAFPQVFAKDPAAETCGRAEDARGLQECCEFCM